MTTGRPADSTRLIRVSEVTGVFGSGDCAITDPLDRSDGVLDTVVASR